MLWGGDKDKETVQSWVVAIKQRTYVLFKRTTYMIMFKITFIKTAFV